MSKKSILLSLTKRYQILYWDTHIDNIKAAWSDFFLAIAVLNDNHANQSSCTVTDFHLFLHLQNRSHFKDRKIQSKYKLLQYGKTKIKTS